MLVPQIRLMDPTALMNQALVNHVIDLADEVSIPYQVALYRSVAPGNIAAAVHLHGEGVPCIVIAVPARYIHSLTV